jgi:hypothetical protein
MRKILFSVLAASAALSAVPASAQRWEVRPAVQREIRGDIDQMQNRIERAVQRGNVSRREAVGLRRQAANVQQLYHRFARNGLDRNEVRQLENQVNLLRQRLRIERRDWDGRRG